MTTNTGRHTYDTSTHIRSTQAKGTGRRISGTSLVSDIAVFVLKRDVKLQRTHSDTSARIYSPCATDMGKQEELDLCRYLHIGIGLAAVHRCPQLLASLENSSAEL